MLDEGTILRQWAARGFSGGVWEDHPQQIRSGFVHAENKLMMVVAGEVELEVAGERRALSPGEEIFIPAGTRHTIRTLGASDARWLYAYAARQTRLQMAAY